MVKLIEIGLNNWIHLWESVADKLPEITLKAMPRLFKQVERINFDQMSDKLSSMREECTVWRDNSETRMNLSAMLGT